MKTREFVRKLRERGIRFHVDGDDLRVVAPRDDLTPELEAALRERKGEILDLLRRGPGGGRPPALQASEEAGAAPLSFAQERMWFLDRMEPGSTAYNRPFAFRIRGPLDTRALAWSLRRIVERHDVLRTRFRMSGGEPVQEVEVEALPALRTVDLSGTGQEREDRLREELDREARTPFDLSRGPLARFLLVRLGDEDHVFLHDVHHSVSDGWSTGVLHRELEELYGARVDGRDAELPALPIQYADFARWQRRWLQGTALEDRLRYWKEQLGGELPVLELPLDRPRPPIQGVRGARITSTLPPDLTDGVRRLARSEGGTPFMVLYAAFAALLHRYGGQDDVTVGTPVAGRTRTAMEGLIGLFINTVALRTDLSGDPSFRALLARARETALEAMEHQEVPFEKVVEALRPERSVSHHPLYQVLFTFHDASEAALRLPGLEVTPVPVDRGTTYMDLDLAVGDAGDELRLSLRYNTDLFDEDTAERLLEHYRTLLAGAVADPDRPVSRLPVLTDGERRRILEEWNDTEAELGDPRPIHHLLEEQARRTPDRAALVAGGEEIAYGELEGRAEALARRLRGKGVEAGSLVAVATERTPGMLVSVLAVLKAGGAYLPVDPSLPERRIRFMLEDSGARVAVADEVGRDALGDARVTIVPVDREGREPDAHDHTPAFSPTEAEERPGAGPGDLAYCIYTSGSTGKPKGVEVEHRSAYNFLRAMARLPGIDESDVVAAVTTLSFDISVLELFLPLSVGARIVLVDHETAADGRALLRRLGEHGVTLLQATPATWRLLLEAGWSGDPQLRVLCGGEALPPDLARSLTERSEEVWNLYGPTETTVWSARYRLPEGGEPVRIGGPIENTRLYVLDRTLGPVPVGAPGELWIGGAGVTRGYHERPELNAERFLDDPFADRPGARMYRTGDRARWRPDGTLEYLGRIDHQVKLRGFRIELGEVESVLGGLEEVEEAACAVRRDQVGEKRLVAYVVFRGGRALTVSEVRSALLESLPDYMVPSLVLEMDALPLTPSGKIDRNALPDPLAAGPLGVRTGTHPPSTPMEKLVAEVWGELLQVDGIGRQDNFFDLGGHSLLSMRAVHRIEIRTGAELNPRVMILNTLEQIAAEVERLADGDDAGSRGREVPAAEGAGT